MYSNDFFQNTNMESNINGNQNYVNQDMDIDVNMTNYNSQGMNMPSPCGEGVQERVINRTFVHEVPHTCPIHTRIINHHVYKHTYRPVYTCSEENVCSNVQCGSCSQFH
ncbi:MAG: hypothetical protein IJI60_03470 [Bacilli bacterium]|nr:hypothetical protein [Bacilli bacterium]